VSHTGQDYETIENTLDRDHFMTADEAKDFGLVDEVIEKRPEVQEGLTHPGRWPSRLHGWPCRLQECCMAHWVSNPAHNDAAALMIC
jgi:hypothetical protein